MYFRRNQYEMLTNKKQHFYLYHAAEVHIDQEFR